MGEQERARKIATAYCDSANARLAWYEDVKLLARAYLDLLAAYEDSQAAFERAAADCVRLEGALAQIAFDRGGTSELAAHMRGIARRALSESGAVRRTVEGIPPEALAATPKPVVEEAEAYEAHIDRVLGHCRHGVDLDREFCPEGCRV